MSSIDHDQDREIAEAPAEQLEVDGDASSNADTSRALTTDTVSDGLTEDNSEGPYHARSNSVKKPLTFKAVSVTKNFLAKAGTPPTPANKGNGEKCKTF